MPPRVCLITTGHLSTCPRMLKAADALHAAGHHVDVVAIRAGGWAAEADERLRATRPWQLRVVDCGRSSAPPRWLWSGVRQRASEVMTELSASPGLQLLTRALSRVAPEVVRVARETRADLYYAGAAGAIGLSALAAQGTGAAYAIDFEDAHGLEPLETHDEARANQFVQLEALAIGGAQFVSAAGDGVAGYYRERHGVEALVINNTFELGPAPKPTVNDGEPLSFYWFSQTIGPRRGLEILVDAMGRANLPARLTLQGLADESFVNSLRERARVRAPLVDLRIQPPADPDEMVRLASSHEIGVSLEDEAIPHRAICAPNKLFLYLAAGLAVVATPTPGQLPVLESARDGWVPLTRGESTQFDHAIHGWFSHREELAQARHAAWAAAAKRWRWDHLLERDALIARVNATLQ